jgi:hypothetical protein
VTDRQADIECYINMYKSGHGVKPKGLELQSWTVKQLRAGIEVLNKMSKKYEQ